MSKETMQWLNTMILNGFTDKRGEAWWYSEADQGDETTSYPGAIPLADVERRLFNFQVSGVGLYVPNNGGGMTLVEGRKAMVTSDTNEVLGIFKEGYQGHDYKEWLVENVATILDADLSIGSAGLLKNRAQAFVQVEMPENISTPEGVAFRPNLLAVTSFDGSLATTYKPTATIVVCDNTMSAGLSEKSDAYKVKHSKYSALKIASAREALSIIYGIADDFAAEVAELCSWTVTDEQFATFLSALVPVPEYEDNKRGNTVANDKQATLRALYRSDDRCAPWQGTAFGVLQATNTYMHHSAQVRGGTSRAVRNMENVVTDKFANADSNVLTLLKSVCEN